MKKTERNLKENLKKLYGLATTTTGKRGSNPKQSEEEVCTHFDDDYRINTVGAPLLFPYIPH